MSTLSTTWLGNMLKCLTEKDVIRVGKETLEAGKKF